MSEIHERILLAAQSDLSVRVYSTTPENPLVRIGQLTLAGQEAASAVLDLARANLLAHRGPTIAAADHYQITPAGRRRVAELLAR